MSADGTQLVLSFLLTNSGTGDEGAFWDSLNPETWNTEDGWSMSLGSGSLNYVSNARSLNAMDKSFFHYKGSETAPPCSEGVEHIVLETPVYIPIRTLDTLR